MPVKGIRGNKLAQEILRLSDQLEGQFRRDFLDEVSAYANNSVLKKLLNDIDSGKFTSTSSVSTALEKVVFASDRLDAIARKAMGKSARISGKVTLGFEPSFNVINPEVISVARTMSINLSTALNKSTKEILRKIIQDAVEGNLTVIQASRKIRNHVGLLPAHSDAVDRYYETLVQSGAKVKIAQQQADAYAQRLLKYRSETIARTEVARAVGEGQTAMWKQMIQDGYLPTDAKRVWITHIDERTCPICEPMNGVETDVYGSWDTPNGFVMYPSATHPNCRCSSGIVMPKASRSKIGKTSELELSQWLLSKYNTNHDELGRFASSPEGVRRGNVTSNHKKIEVMNAARAPQDWNNTRFNVVPIIAEDLQGFEDVLNNEPSAENKKVASRGPKGTKVGTDGLPIMLSEKMANEKYGSTIDEVMQHIADNHGIDIAYDDRDPQYEATDKRVLQGCAQFFDDASASGIDLEGDISEVVFTNGASNRYIGAYWTYDKHIEIYTDKVHEMKNRMGREYLGGNPQLVADAFGQTLGKKYNADQIANGALDSANGYAIMSHESAHAVDYKETNLTAKATTKLRALLKQNFESKLKESPATFTPEEVTRYKKDPLEALNRFGADGYNIRYEDGTVWVKQSAYSEGKQTREMSATSSQYARFRKNPTTAVSEYSRTNSRELFAENFSAWFLLSKAKSKSASEYYKRNVSGIAYTVAVSDGIMKQEQYAVYDSTDIFSINHPVGIFILSQTDSSQEDVEKANPNHDEIGRFATGSGTRSSSLPKKPKVKRKAKVPSSTEYNNMSDSDYFKLAEAQSKIDMTVEERTTVRSYAGMDYENINQYLRGTFVGFTTSPKAAELFRERTESDAKEMTDLYDKISVPLEENTTVFRGISVPKSKKFKVGSKFTDKGFSSTSTSPIEASSFATGRTDNGDDGVVRSSVLLEIRIPKGRKVLPMGKRLSSYHDENEILLKNSTKFMVVEIKKTPNDKIKERVVVEVVGD